MCDVGLLVPQRHRSDEPFHLHWFSCKALADECCFCHHSLPCLLFALSGTHDLEHLILRNSPHFRQWYSILGCLIFPLFLDSSRQCLRILLALTVKKVRGKSTVRNGARVFLFDIAFIVGLESFLELNLLRMSLSM